MFIFFDVVNTWLILCDHAYKKTYKPYLNYTFKNLWINPSTGSLL